MDQEQDKFDRRVKSPVFVFCDKMIFLVKVNIIMLLFTLAGGILLGIFPAIFAAIKQYTLFEQEDEPQLFKTMWKNYKFYFKKANLFGMLFCLITVMILCNIIFIPQIGNIVMGTLLLAISAIVGLGALLSLMYLPSLIVIYDASLVKCAQLGIILGLGKFYDTIKLIALLAVSVIGLVMLPQFGVFVALSLLSFICYTTTKRLVKPYLLLEKA